ncbi:MAG: squalene synthase HpnC [Bryobacteraceae bacterium]
MEFLEPIPFLQSPEASSRPWTSAEALAYTRWLATRHYENFHVVSLLLPKRLHQDFYNVYAFCRWADDLGDETGNPQESLRLLAWWRARLRALFAGEPPSHPVFLALSETIARHQLPLQPFDDLIDAFIQDQTVTRYEDWNHLLDYCRRSANPVGRLVLMLCGYRDEERFRLSDATCTALQLANFWQDVSVDLDKGRIYIPQHLLALHGCPEQDVLARRATPAFRRALRDAVDYAQALFEQGLPLSRRVDRRLALDIDLFSRGGLKVLEKIRAQDYDVFRSRPVISKSERALLFLASLARLAFRKAA